MRNIILILAITFVAGTCLAQMSTGPDVVGIYYDTTAFVNCMDNVPLYAPIDLYICFTNISTTSGISGWEANVDIQPAPPIPPTFTLMGPGALNVSTAPDFVVGHAGCLPWASSMPVLSITITPLAAIPTSFYLSGADISSFGGFPGYATCADPGDLRACDIHYCGPAGLTATMFQICGCPSEDATWGGVKNLYR